MIKIAPSILSADFAKLGEDIKKIEEIADMIHVDVMDGHFAPNISIGVPVVKSVRQITKLPLDVHLMIDNPEKYIEQFANAGADIITVHAEVSNPATIDLIKGTGKKAGISINPATPVAELEPFLNKIDMALVMTVNPGFGGQKFMKECVRKVGDVKKMLMDRKLGFDIEVDGGINAKNASLPVQAGANILVAGSSVFHSEDPAMAIEEIKNSL